MEVPPELPDWLRKILEWFLSLFGAAGGGTLLTVLFWIVIAVVVVVLLRWLVGEWQHRRRTAAEGKGGSGFTEVPLTDLGPLPDPEALARAGEFAAAVHALLLHAQQALVTRQKFDLRAAHTSREVLNHAKIAAPATLELRGLVLAVEVSRFGGAAVDRHDFDRCRERFSRFVTAVDEEAA